MQKFKAYRTFEDNKVVTSRFVEMTLDELDPGEVVVRTKYSTINYKDALSYNGTGRIMRKYPTNAGIDMAGTVESSTDARWKRGDKVIVHGYDLGVAHDGGYSEFVRVPGDWVVRRPESMTAFDAMTLGTAGFTAAQAIMLMEHNGLEARERARSPSPARPAAWARSRSRSSRRPATTSSRSPASRRRRDYLKGAGREGSAAAPVDRPREDPPARQGDVGRRRRQPRRRHARLAAVDDEDRRHGGRGRPRGRHEAQHDGGAVHPARCRAARRRQRELPDVAAAEGLEQARRRVAARPVHDQVRTIDFDELPTHFDPYLKGMVRGRTVVRIAPIASLTRRADHARCRAAAASTRMAAMATTYKEFHRRSIADRDAFWRERGRADRLADAVLVGARLLEAAVRAWFVGGRTNLCHNAVDRHLATRGDQKALVYISTETGAASAATRTASSPPR